MKYFITVFFLTVISTITLAQEILPKGLTEEEKKDYHEYLKHFEYGDKNTQPPSTPPRTPAEFEEMDAVLLTWGGFSDELREIARHASQRVFVYIVADNPSAVQNFLTQGGVSMDNIFILTLDFNSIWVRDFGPQSVYLDGTDELALVDWVYNRPHRPEDNLIPYNFANVLDVPVFQMTSEPNKLTHTGGNLMFDGHGKAFSSELILAENASLTESQIDDIMYEYTGTETYIKMAELPYDNISHLDMHMKLIDEETLLVGEFPQGISDGPDIEENLAYLLNNYQTPYGRDYEVVRIPMVPSPTGNYPPSAYYRTYTNSVFLNDLVLVPSYYDSALNSQAISIYQEAMPGYEIIGIDMEDVIGLSGAIHCITRDIAAQDPIFIAHASIREAHVEMDEFPVEATITNANGIETASVFYAIQGDDTFAEIPMQKEGTDTYSASIPAQECGSTIYYFISATNSNDKTITKPLVTPGNAWSFHVDGEVLDFAASATSANINETITFQFTGCIDEENADAIIWEFGEGANPATANGIGQHDVSWETTGHKTITLQWEDQQLTKENHILITAEPTYDLTIDTQGEGQTQPPEGTYAYTENENVQLTAEAAEGWLFEKWVVNQSTEYTEEQIQVVMDDDMDAVAVFSQVETAIPGLSQAFHFNIFPNPAQDIFNVVMTPSGGPVDIEVHTLHGRQIYHKTVVSHHWDEKFQVDLSGRNPGIYMVRITWPQGSESRKLILR